METTGTVGQRRAIEFARASTILVRLRRVAFSTRCPQILLAALCLGTVSASARAFDEVVIQGPWEGDTEVFEAANLKARYRGGRLELQWRPPGRATFEPVWRMTPDVLQPVVPCDYECFGDEYLPCYEKCIRSYRPILFDRASEALFVHVSLDVGQNVGIAVVRVDLRAREGTLLFTDYGSGIGELAVSPDRRRAAYSLGWHGSACYGGRTPRIVEFATGKALELEFTPVSEDGVITSAFDPRWSSPTRVEFRTIRHRCIEMESVPGEAGTLVVDVTSNERQRAPR
ncbi:MAG: hypothetical protein AMXMBFR36_25750 [Acidobacteriota bacterium]